MYGSMEAGTKSSAPTEYQPMQDFERSQDRRLQFAKRRSTKRRLKELQHDRPVLETVLQGPSSRELHEKKETRDVPPPGSWQEDGSTQRRRHSFLYTMLSMTPHAKSVFFCYNPLYV